MFCGFMSQWARPCRCRHCTACSSIVTVSEPVHLHSVFAVRRLPLGRVSVSVCMRAVQPWPPSCSGSLGSTICICIITKSLACHRQSIDKFWKTYNEHMLRDDFAALKQLVLHGRVIRQVLKAVFKSSPSLYLQSHSK